ncbi:hypothetical protein V5799_021098 [Amblyomma americanum]|uniref:Secreted protein n=1 Tax=Amblyomma americanum TaxID=6943 RepID=A0AAQ4FRL7_AMBAM
MGTLPGFAPALLLLLSTAASVDIDTSDEGYKDLRVSIGDNVPPDESITDNIKNYVHKCTYHHGSSHASLYKGVYSPSDAADDSTDDCDDEDFDDDQENNDVDHQEHNTEHEAYASDDKIDDHHHK